VAEGVETGSQRDRLQDLMCDEMQGFLLARPLSADAFGTLLEQKEINV
jgi:diguanylate cyclase